MKVALVRCGIICLICVSIFTGCAIGVNELRQQFIRLYREFCLACRTAWESWKKGCFDIQYPPGAFLPPRRPYTNSVYGVP